MATALVAAEASIQEVGRGENHETLLVPVEILAELKLSVFHLVNAPIISQNTPMDPLEAKNRIWHYILDTEGNLWHEGSLFEDPALLKFFMRKMERLPDGRFKVLCQGETCYIEPQDTPYVILSLDRKEGQIELVFPGDYRETLDPATLWVGKDNVLYCKVRGGAYDARFSRKPFWEITHWVEQDPIDKKFYLRLGDHRFKIGGLD